jgi:hypothetical protein
VVVHEVSPRRRNQRRQTLDELERCERDACSAIRPRALDRHPDEAGRCLLQPGASESRTGQIPTAWLTKTPSEPSAAAEPSNVSIRKLCQLLSTPTISLKFYIVLDN